MQKKLKMYVAHNIRKLHYENAEWFLIQTDICTTKLYNVHITHSTDELHQQTVEAH